MPSIVLNNIKYSGLSIGKNVIVSKIEPIIGGNRVTFSYTLDSGIVETQSLEIMNGEKGTSIVNATVEDGNKLILSLSDGTEINAGTITIDSSNLQLEGYYTSKETDEKFVQKLDLNTLIKDCLDANITRISSEEIKELF